MDDLGKVNLWGAAGSQPQRRTRRTSMFLQASIRFGEEPAAPFRVRNLSAGGMMVECDLPPPAGTRVEAAIRGLDLISGTVAWINPGSAGISFDVPIDPALAAKRTRRSVHPDHLMKPTRTISRRPKLKVD